MAQIVIIDYGMANLRSVQKAFQATGHAAEITADPERIANATKLVLPGVGALRDAIHGLRETHLADAVLDHIHDGLPFLGICLGMQMLFTRGHEDGLHPCLDVIPGEVIRFPRVPGLKVPHMGWNTLSVTAPDCPLFRGLPPNPAVYFVHSYYPTPLDSRVVAATAEYPTPFPSVIWHENIFATQFHPEKSQGIGLKMLQNFAEL
ncbi:MAG: imidazole glycerol phosphate synthase subunit HisH [Gemmataceae bacterium]